MAQVSIVTVAREEAAAVAAAAAEQEGPAVVLLNPGAREFLPWWRLASGAKALSVDAPEFVKTAASKGAPLAADAGGNKALSVEAPEFVKTAASEGVPPAADAGGNKVLSVDAPEFVKTAASKEAPPAADAGGDKALSVDAPEFEKTPASKGAPPAAADSGGKNAAPGSNVRTGRRAAYRPRRFSRWQEAVRRTIFVKYIDHIVTEQMLAELFGLYGTVVDCRICGDPSNGLRFAFVELQYEEEAYAALFLDGTVIWISPLRVSPSRTAICPINPAFLPQSEAEWELCSRTVYCTNISKIIRGDNLKAFCEAYFGKVCRYKLLDNDKRSTNLAFIEFAEADGAISALGSGAIFAGGHRLRMCPSKTPIRDNCYGSSSPVLEVSVPFAETENQQAATPQEEEVVAENGVSTMVS